MKFRLFAINLLLLAGIGATVWRWRLQRSDAEALRLRNLNVAVKPLPAPPLAPVPKPDAPPATKYAEVATKDLFSKDRSPVVIVEAPKVDPPKVMPPLPVVYGVMGLPSGAKAIVAPKAGVPSRTVKTGDTVGEFTILALDTQNITLGWDGKQFPRKIEDLIDRSAPSGAAGNAPPLPTTPTMVQVPLATPQQSAAQQPPPQPVGGLQNSLQSGPGPNVGTPDSPAFACRPGDTTPAGTVQNGLKKTITYSPFGATCRWLPGQ